jgi:hypothetical protein
MDADGLTIFDIEHALLTGHIVLRQRDRATGERKYVISGPSLDDANRVSVAVRLEN